MKKPLELKIYPMWENGLDGTLYADKDDRLHPTRVDFEVYRKRLTEPELAAEWHKQDNRCGQKLEGYAVAHNGEGLGAEEVEIDRLRTIYRFATLPHHDEEPAG